MEMDIEIQRTAESLDKGNRTGLSRLSSKPRFLNKVGRDAAVDNAKHPPHDLGPAGEQETQRVRETQYPLAHGLFGQYFVNQQGRTFGHATCTTARAEPSSFAAESNQVLGMAGLAAHPQEAMHQAPALQVRLERRVVFVYELIKESALRAMAHIRRCGDTRAGFPANR